MPRVRLKRVLIVYPGLDITRKSGQGQALVFAPTWDMVRRHKGGVMSDQEYIDKYHAILESARKEDWAWLADQAKDGLLQLRCYCLPSKPFCHTSFLIDWAVKEMPEMFEYEADSPDSCSE